MESMHEQESTIDSEVTKQITTTKTITKEFNEVRANIEAEQAKVMEEFEKKLIKAKKEEKTKHEAALKVTETIEKQAQTTRAEEDSMKLKKVELEASISEI